MRSWWDGKAQQSETAGVRLNAAGRVLPGEGSQLAGFAQPEGAALDF